MLICRFNFIPHLFLHKQKNNLIIKFFLEMIHFKESCSLIGRLADNSKTRILRNKGFAMESQNLKELSFCIVFRKMKWQNFQKNAKYPTLGPFCPNLGKNEFSRKIVLCHVLASIVSPLTSCTKSEKTNEPIVRKNS